MLCLQRPGRRACSGKQVLSWLQDNKRDLSDYTLYMCEWCAPPYSPDSASLLAANRGYVAHVEERACVPVIPVAAGFGREELSGPARAAFLR